jgi:bifunctional UDP-N-acetylglucosamine pyrophosphorylase/glucosamine-1-phosphate N-acetyltransferase
MSVRAIVLAAGKGTRMKCELPKLLHTVAGRPIIATLIDEVMRAGVDDVTVVVGHESDAVASVLPESVRLVHQPEQLGTGHAAEVALEGIGDVSGDTVLVVPGDSPLFRAETLRRLLDAHRPPATLLTVELADPTGYGRVLRDGDSVVGIVEEADADDDQRSIHEVAVSTYTFDGSALSAALSRLTTDNAQSEKYLTDVIGILTESGPVGAMLADDPTEGLQVNSHDQLAMVDGAVRMRINQRLMEGGVWMQDPATTYVDATATVEPGVRLYAGAHIEGSSVVESGATIGPQTFLLDSRIGSGSRVWYSVVRGAEVGANVDVGPYASLRPGTILGDGSKAGTFVEIKEATVGEGAKVPHLSYIGDAEIGARSNLGAGTITCNYDGFRKHRTVIGADVFVGSDTMLVAPVELGDGSYTGAGSVITRDVSPGSLAVERSAQKEIPGYADRRARLREAEDE